MVVHNTRDYSTDLTLAKILLKWVSLKMYWPFPPDILRGGVTSARTLYSINVESKTSNRKVDLICRWHFTISRVCWFLLCWLFFWFSPSSYGLLVLVSIWSTQTFHLSLSETTQTINSLCIKSKSCTFTLLHSWDDLQMHWKTVGYDCN